MRFAVCILILLFYSSFSQAQNSFFRQYQAAATAFAGSPSWVSDGEGGAIVAATLFAANQSNNRRLGLIALDNRGNIRWQTAFASDQQDVVVSQIIRDTDGSLYIAGMCNLSAGHLPQPFVAAFDAFGRFRWSRRLGSGLVDGRVKIAIRKQEIGLAFTAIHQLYDFSLVRFDKNGQYRGALFAGGGNLVGQFSEDILADLVVDQQGNFIAVLETNYGDPGRFCTAVLLFNNQSGIGSSYRLEHPGNFKAVQAQIVDNNRLLLGIKTENQQYWYLSQTNGQDLVPAFGIDSTQAHQQYFGHYHGGEFVAQGPLGQADGAWQLIKRGSESAGWLLQGNSGLYGSRSAPIVDNKGQWLMLATASYQGAAFAEQLILVKSPSNLDICYENKSFQTRAINAPTPQRNSFGVAAQQYTEVMLPIAWQAVTSQFQALEPTCNTANNIPLFPTAFTPNGDGLNETFGPVFNDFPYYQLLIYNRWGELIFDTPNQFWDGYILTELAPAGAYRFVFNYQDLRGRLSQSSGQFRLIR